MYQTRRVLIVSLLVVTACLSEPVCLRSAIPEEHRAWRRAHDADRLYDPIAETSRSGRVVRVETAISAQRHSHAVHLLLDTGEELIWVHLGPLSFLQGLQSTLKAGAPVTVKGSLSPSKKIGF